MFASTNFTTRTELALAVEQGQEIVLYNPNLGTPEFNGRAHVEGPWFKGPGVTGWRATVEVQDMRVVRVLPDWRHVGQRRPPKHGPVRSVKTLPPMVVHDA
jgi:hypothetical protein